MDLVEKTSLRRLNINHLRKRINMQITEMRTFNRYIKQLDPQERIVKIDLDRKEIRYSDEIKQHRKIRELTGEEIVRAYLILKLINTLKYPIDCIELEKTHTIGRSTKRTSARIDVLVRNNDNSYNTFMIIEVKAPDTYDKEMEEIKTQLFQVAKLEKGTQYLIYYTAYLFEQQIRERVVSISFSMFDSYKEWEKEGKQDLMGIPPEYGLIKKPVFTKAGIPDLRKDVTKDELERKRKELHNFLWGGGRYTGNEIFNFIMKLFLAKIYDEKETVDNKAYKFQIFQENGKQEDAKKTTERINELYKIALNKYLHFPEDEVNRRDVRRIGDKVLDYNKVKVVVQSFQDISLTENVYDVLGEFFERFLWDEFKQSKGQFFTHPNIVNFIIKALSLEDLAIQKINEESSLPFIIDPSCGSGTFLIESMKTITNHVLKNADNLQKNRNVEEFIASKFPKNRKHAWAEKYLYGLDFNEDLAMATKINMVMHGDGSGNIESEDALSRFDSFLDILLKIEKQSSVYPKPVNEQFDVLMSNPPFSITLRKELEEDLPNLFAYTTKDDSENSFIERWYQLLKPKGRLGAVLPESVFDTTDNKKIRLFLYRFFWIKAVVSLPSLAFEPYTSTRTSILIAQKKDAQAVEEYGKVWKKYEEEFEKLSTDVKKALDQQDLSLFENNALFRETFVNLLKSFLMKYFEEADSNLPLAELRNKYTKKIKEVDGDWWIFSKVSEELDYDILMAEAEEIGYKRTTRSERERPNDLGEIRRQNGTIEYVFSSNNPQTALDYIRRDVFWH
jgi:type I restriction enzyme M protein